MFRLAYIVKRDICTKRLARFRVVTFSPDAFYFIFFLRRYESESRQGKREREKEREIYNNRHYSP
jgi:hypothetical protein